MTKALGENLIPAIKEKIEASKIKLYDDFGSAIDGALTQKAISEKLDQIVQRDISVTGNESTVKLSVKVSNIKLSIATTKEIPLPVASETQAGVVNSATYKSIQELSEKVEALLGATVSISGLPSSPAQQELTDAWKQETGKENLINGARIDDSSNNKIWTYYSNTDEWRPADSSSTSVSVSGFTNTSAGTIKGSTEKYKVFAEADLTGSVNGLDDLESKITNAISDLTALQTAVGTNTTNITNLTTNKQDVLTDTGDKQNLKTVNNQTLLGKGNVDIEVPEHLTLAEFEAAWSVA